MTAGSARVHGQAVAVGLALVACVTLGTAPALGASGDDDVPADREASEALVTWGTGPAAPPITLPAAVIRPVPADDVPRPSPPPETLHDEIRLRDGRQIQGHIVERSPGRWLIIETDGGRRRTLAWDTVAEIDAAPPERDAPQAEASAADTAAWRKRSGWGPTYELRANLSTLSMPERTFRLTGNCSTGSGSVPVSMYGQTASDGALGFGGGVGGRAGIVYRTRLDPDGASSWYAFRATAGADLHVHHLHVPTGIPPVNGGLCSEVSRATYELEYQSDASLLVQVPLVLGGQIALGKLDGLRWSGVVLGAGYAPSFVHAGAFTTLASSHLNPLGLELTVDFAVLHASTKYRPPEPQVRVTFFFSPHTQDSQPAIGTVSIGAVWY